MAKQYSINIENDDIIFVEVDGVRYENPDDIPDEGDRERILALMAAHQNEAMDFAMDMSDVESDFSMDLPPGAPSLVPNVIIPLFLGISVVCLGMGAIAGVKAQQLMAREVTTTGHIVEITSRRDEEEGTTFFYPTAVFYLPGERRQTFQVGGYSPEAPYEVGEEVAIAYDPDNPRNARVKSAGSAIGLWILPGILGTLGAVFGGATLLALWIIRADVGKGH